ncbi:MAG: hypothetical protein ABIG67_07385 [Pseudomonadota bacterium]
MTSDLRVLERQLLDAHYPPSVAGYCGGRVHSAKASVAQTLKSKVTAIAGGIFFEIRL